MLEAIFFDLDDTLCNTSASRFERARLVADVIRGHDSTFSVSALIEMLLTPMAGTPWPQGPRPILEKLGLAETDAGQRARGLWFFRGCEHLMGSYENRDDTIRLLVSKFRLGVITNGDDAIQRHKFDALGLAHHFEVFVTSEVAGAFKPDAAIFHHALSRLGIDASRAAFVGDNLEVDVVGAQQSGMRAIWFNPDGLELPAPVTPDAIVACYAGLPVVLAGL